MNNRMLQVGGLSFEIRRSDRRRTMGISVGRLGELRVHAPLSAPEEELAAWVQRKLLWVHRKLALKAGNAVNLSAAEFVTGESFSYLGRTYRLQLVDKQREALRFDGSAFLLRRDARDKGEQHFRIWYRRCGQPWAEARVRHLAPRVGQSPSRVVVRDLAYRWGSCSGRSEAVLLHWKLLQLPVRLVDYVIVHELAHLAESNHGPDFWARVERALPDWRERRDELGECALRFLRADRKSAG